MLAKVQSAAVMGVDAFDVEIEVNAGVGIINLSWWGYRMRR